MDKEIKIPPESIEVTSHSIGNNRAYHCSMLLDQGQFRLLGTQLFSAALKLAAEKIADKLVEEHYQEISKNIDPQAIANLSIANAAAKTRELLDQKLPERVEKAVEVYHTGLFGTRRVR